MNLIRATLKKERSTVANMFDEVAKRYDLMNTLMTLNADQTWRQTVLTALDPKPGEIILDLAAGTGSSSQPIWQTGAKVFPIDISQGMLKVGKARLPHLPFTVGDALKLPFADNTFDKVTISYGLRNIADTLSALKEMRRVTKPNGILLICEFSTPRNMVFRQLYKYYLQLGIPTLAKFSSNREAYKYFGESVLNWPTQEELADLISQADWHQVQWQNLSGGVVCLHRAWAGANK